MKYFLLTIAIIVAVSLYYYNNNTKESFTSSGTVMQLMASGRQDKHLTRYPDSGTIEYDGWYPGVPDWRRSMGVVPPLTKN